MNKKQKLYLRVRSLMPDFWIMNEPYSQAWDEKMNDMMNNNIPVIWSDIFYAHVSFGKYYLWVLNYPYSCFDYKGNRPSRKTILRFKKYSEWWKYNQPTKSKNNVVNLR